MRNHRTLDASIDEAVHLFRAGRVTMEEAAEACGIPLGTLQAHLTGIEATPEPSAHASPALTGSPRTCRYKAHTAESARPKAGKAKAHATDHFVFYQENGRWRWDRVSDCNDVVRTCRYGFANYLDCVNDAKKHGWKGTPWFFAASDRFLS